jgi:hypothetical protein
MFAARGIAVSFSLFLLVYCGLSMGVGFACRKAPLHRYPPSRVADFLFALRLLPLIAALGLTAAFVVPSFLLLEPRAIDEPMGGIPVALSISGLMLIVFGLWNAVAAARQASRTIALWTRDAEPVERCGAVPILRIFRAAPALTAAGILRPRVLLSGAAEFRLSPTELQTALRHEFAHVCHWDNWKKLLFRCLPFPGMRRLEIAWSEAAEMAADDAAVRSAAEALDLAAAIIKLSSLGSSVEILCTDLSTALVSSGAAASTNARVERLIGWSAERRVLPHRHAFWYALAASVTMIAALAATYGQLLVQVHAATEWLVR